jgi:hypothetical protein
MTDTAEVLSDHEGIGTKKTPDIKTNKYSKSRLKSAAQVKRNN